MSILIGSLNLTTRTALSYRDAPDNFADLILLLRRIDTDLDLLSSESKRVTYGHERKTTRPRSPVPDRMDWTPTPNVTVSSAQVRKEDHGLVGKRAKWVGEEEQERRRREGRCYRCGRDGCGIRSCPLKPARMPNRPGSPRQRPRVTIAMIEEDPPSEQRPQRYHERRERTRVTRAEALTEVPMEESERSDQESVYEYSEKE